MQHVIRLKHMRIRMEEAYVPERKCKHPCVTVLSEAHPSEAFSDSRWWIYPTGMSRGQDTHAGKACSERAGLGKTGTGAEPCSALRVWLAHRVSCHLANARWPRNCEATQRQKCTLFFLYVEVGSLEARLACIEGHWTPLP